ncbi:MAG: hypothetical protein ACK2UN_17285, partial [Candidatus Promineifilaceae bacterium]
FGWRRRRWGRIAISKFSIINWVFGRPLGRDADLYGHGSTLHWIKKKALAQEVDANAFFLRPDCLLVESTG